jgi:hypothetical protein
VQHYAELSAWKLPTPPDPTTFERYGWQCYLCGEPTPKEAARTGAPNSPTVDHIIPLCLGGTNADINLACSCRACNMRKSAKHPIRYWREQHAMPLERVAKLLGVTVQRLESIEHGDDHHGVQDMLMNLAPFGWTGYHRGSWYL